MGRWLGAGEPFRMGRGPRHRLEGQLDQPRGPGGDAGSWDARWGPACQKIPGAVTWETPWPAPAGTLSVTLKHRERTVLWVRGCCADKTSFLIKVSPPKEQKTCSFYSSVVSPSTELPLITKGGHWRQMSILLKAVALSAR